MRFVHESDDGSMLIVAVLCDAFGDDGNGFLVSLTDSVPEYDRGRGDSVRLNPLQLFDTIDTSLYSTYIGSDTIPPCYESTWIVFSETCNAPDAFINRLCNL